MIEQQTSVPDTEAYQQSLSLLHRCLTPAGFVAASTDVDNYARVWARDGVITSLAALASVDATLLAGVERTLSTLADHQGPHGEIPSNVTVDGKEVSYGRLVGRVDALLWYVIGVSAFIHHTKRSSRKVRYWLSVERALQLAEAWEYNNRGLLYTPIAGDWADEYLLQGYILSDLLLYERALYGAGVVFKNKAWQQKAAELRRVLEVNYWPKASLCDDPLVYHQHAYRYQAQQSELGYWLPAFSPGGYSTVFDGLAHALSLTVDLGDEEQRQKVMSYVQSLETETGSALLPAFWPVIQHDDPQWEALEANHLYGEVKNQPYLYHNGGLWPMVTGFYALGLMRQGEQEHALRLLNAINEANRQGRDGQEWEFAEYHHGLTHLPLGTQHVAWSAAAGVLAHQSIWQKISPWPL